MPSPRQADAGGRAPPEIRFHNSRARGTTPPGGAPVGAPAFASPNERTAGPAQTGQRRTSSCSIHRRTYLEVPDGHPKPSGARQPHAVADLPPCPICTARAAACASGSRPATCVSRTARAAWREARPSRRWRSAPTTLDGRAGRGSPKPRSSPTREPSNDPAPARCPGAPGTALNSRRRSGVCRRTMAEPHLFDTPLVKPRAVVAPHQRRGHRRQCPGGDP